MSRRRPACARPLRGPLGVLAGLATLLVGVQSFLYAGKSGPGRFDRWIQAELLDRLPVVHVVALRIDWIGELTGRLVAVGALAALCLVIGRRRLAVVTLVATVLTSFATTGLKVVVDHRIHDEFQSYPSGHTAVVAAMGVVVALLLVDLTGAGRMVGTLAVLVVPAAAGAVMAWAQVGLNAHYPTDTIGGFGTAVAVVAVTVLLVDPIADAGTS